MSMSWKSLLPYLGRQTFICHLYGKAFLNNDYVLCTPPGLINTKIFLHYAPQLQDAFWKYFSSMGT